MHKIKKYFITHKIISALAVAVVLGGGYWIYKKTTTASAETRYVVATVEKGTIVTSISGSGQVSASNQVDLKPKASGDVVYVGVKNGQEVKAGALIVQINAKDAEKAVRDAQVNLTTAQLSLEKIKKPADALSVISSENTLARSKESKQNAEDNLKKTYDDGFNTIANAFLDLPDFMTGLHDILYGSTAGLNSGQSNIDYYTQVALQYDARARDFKTDTDAKYEIARASYETALNAYKSATRFSDAPTVEALLERAYKTTRDVAESVKSANNLIQFYKDALTSRNLSPKAIADTNLGSLNTFTGKTNSHLQNLLDAITSIKTTKDSIVNATRTIAENEGSLAKLKAGADPLDVRSSELSLTQRQNALLDARENLANYYVRAPFDGTIAKVNVKKADAASSGTAVATIITKQKIAEIALNEVDIAKVKAGQKVTLTFDAIEDLSITGTVSELDSIGTVSQGVVTYAVKITFDTQDDRVKGGMSVSAAIITEAKQDVLTAPNGAVKSLGGMYYVEMFAKPIVANGGNAGVASAVPPESQVVEIGLANDTETEIISGLNEGDQIVTRTITTSATKTAATQAPSLFGGGAGTRVTGGATGGTGNVRFAR